MWRDIDDNPCERWRTLMADCIVDLAYLGGVSRPIYLAPPSLAMTRALRVLRVTLTRYFSASAIALAATSPSPGMTWL